MRKTNSMFCVAVLKTTCQVDTSHFATVINPAVEAYNNMKAEQQRISEVCHSSSKP